MPVLKDAVIILGIILGCCIFVALGAYMGKTLTLGKLNQMTGVIAIISIIIYTVYISWILLTK
jgi:hypothetical protein